MKDMFYAVYIGVHSFQKTFKFEDQSESLGDPLEDTRLRQNLDSFHSTARIVQYFPQLDRTPC